MNGIRSIPGLTQLARKAHRHRLRDAHSDVAADAFDLECAQADLDEFFGTPHDGAAPRRSTDQHIIRNEKIVAALDDMLAAHSLKSIIATLRSLCDSRCDNGLCESDDLIAVIDAEESAADWRRSADTLEELAESLKVNVT